MEPDTESSFTNVSETLASPEGNLCCRECLLTFETVENLAIHKSRKHRMHVEMQQLQTDNYLCTLCGLYFESLVAHSRSGCKFALNMTTTKPVSLNCKYCGERYENNEQLWLHLISVHRRRQQQQQSSHIDGRKLKNYNCPLCNYSVYKCSDIMHHICRSHLYCKRCSTQFYDVRLFFQHFIGTTTANSNEIIVDDSSSSSSSSISCCTTASVPCLFCRRTYKVFGNYIDHINACKVVRDLCASADEKSSDEISDVVVGNVHYTCAVCREKDNSCCLDFHLWKYHVVNESGRKKPPADKDDLKSQSFAVFELSSEYLNSHSVEATADEFIEACKSKGTANRKKRFKANNAIYNQNTENGSPNK